MRIFTGALATETNTFSPMPTDRTLFEETFYAPAGTHGPKPEFFSGQTFAARKRAASSNWDVVEGLHTFAMPAGKTVKAVYEEYRDQILSELKAALPVDIVALGLHGAMVAEDYDDCEGDLLERVRALVGPKVAVGIEIDPHCHMTERMVKNADAIVIFKEYPLKTLSKVVGVEERCEVLAQLVVAAVVIAPDGRLLEGAVHSLDLSVRPRVIWLGEPMLDLMIPTEQIEHVCSPPGRRT